MTDKSLSPDHVFVIERGEYADRYIAGVAASIDAAIEFIKKPYGPPYVVVWDDAAIQQDETTWTFSGTFGAVPGYCGPGTSSWEQSRASAARATHTSARTDT